MYSGPPDVSPSGSGSSDRLDLAWKEQQQKRHYFYLRELQNMARELPGKYQQRLPYDLLSSLANALLDGTVFEIVNSLKEVQQLEERNLFNQRIRLVNEGRAKKQEMLKKHKDELQKCQGKQHNLAYVNAHIKRDLLTFEKRCEDEVRRRDMKIILELDQKVMDQQVMLEKAGVPGFYVTNNPQEIRIQMYLLEYIVRVSQLDLPS